LRLLWGLHCLHFASEMFVRGCRYSAFNVTRGVWWDVPPECPVGERKPAAPTAAGLAVFINDVAKQSPRCAQQIGGTIRVATIYSAGAR